MNKMDEKIQSYPNIMSIEDIMDYLSISKISAYNLLKNNIIKGAKVGKTWKIKKDNFIEYLNNIGLL